MFVICHGTKGTFVAFEYAYESVFYLINMGMYLFPNNLFDHVLLQCDCEDNCNLYFVDKIT